MIKKIYIGKEIIKDNFDILDIAKCYEEYGKLKLVNTYEEADVIWKQNVRGLDEIIAEDAKYAINAFPKNSTITNKENLYNSILKFIPKKDIYKIIPKTWLLNDANFAEVKKDIIKHLGKNPIIIVKPTNMSQGSGIVVLRLDELDNKFDKNFLIQEYIWDIKTIKHLTEKFQVKFDIRVNLIMDNNGKIFIYNPFLVRASDIEYKLGKNLEPLAHITNTSLREHITDNAAREFDDVAELSEYKKPIIKFIKKYITKLIYKAVYVDPGTHKTKYFQRFGLDLIILSNGEVKLIEINATPGNQIERKNILNKKYSNCNNTLDTFQLIPFLFSDIGIKLNPEHKKHFSILTTGSPVARPGLRPGPI